MNHNFSRRPFYLLALLFTGCAASRTHVGFHFLNERQNIQKTVSRKVDASLLDLERAAVKAIHDYDIAPLLPFFSDKLAKTISPQTVKDFNAHLKTQYKFGESVQQLQLGDLIPHSLPKWGDNFSLFDFVASEFMLDGTPGASLKLYVAKINHALKICGLYIVPLADNISADRSIRGHLAPETFDKQGLFKTQKKVKNAPQN